MKDQADSQHRDILEQSIKHTHTKKNRTKTKNKNLEKVKKFDFQSYYTIELDVQFSRTKKISEDIKK